ncbi:hypothetical protein [Geodermatophilus sp. SYSU D00766]
MTPTRRDWPRLLEELAAQIGDGRIYDRDLGPLAGGLKTALEAIGLRARLLP